MSKDIEYKVVYDTTSLPVKEGVNLLEQFTRKHIINDEVVNEQIIRFVLHDKPKYLPKFVWHKLIKMIVRKEVVLL
jgi:hypothetical protein